MSAPNTEAPAPADREIELEAAAAMLAFVVLMSLGDVAGDLEMESRLRALGDALKLESEDGQPVIPDSRAFHAGAAGLAELLRDRVEEAQGGLTGH